MGRVRSIQHCRFCAARAWDLPNPGNVKAFCEVEKAVVRFERGKPALLRHLHRTPAPDGYFPDLKISPSAFGSEIDPLAIQRPAWDHIVGSGHRRDLPGRSAGHFNDVDFAVLFGAEVERQGTAVGRPTGRARQAGHGSNLHWIGAISVTDPDSRVSGTVGFECDLGPIRRELGMISVPLRRNQHGRLPPRMPTLLYLYLPAILVAAATPPRNPLHPSGKRRIGKSPVNSY